MDKLAQLTDLIRVRQLVASGEARHRRVAHGLSLQDVAVPARVHFSTIQRWETGERVPHGAAALRYLRVLDALDRATREPVAS